MPLSLLHTDLYCSLACITMKSHLWFIHLWRRLYCSWGQKLHLSEWQQAKWITDHTSLYNCHPHLLMQLQDSLLTYVSFSQIDCCNKERSVNWVRHKTECVKQPQLLTIICILNGPLLRGPEVRCLGRTNTEWTEVILSTVRKPFFFVL